MPLYTEVITISNTSTSKMIMTATQIDTKTPSASVFKVPAGYKENTQLNDGMDMMQEMMKLYEEN